MANKETQTYQSWDKAQRTSKYPLPTGQTNP
jgi:hypothetical protein